MDAFSVVARLKDCCKQKDLCQGIKLHGSILEARLLEDPYVGSSLISMYAKCGELGRAQAVHDELPIQTSITWNALISGYARCGRDYDALDCFQQMQSAGLPPDSVTYTCAIKACASIRNALLGKLLHDEVARKALLYQNLVLGTALVDMYAKCGLLFKAQEVLQELHIRDAVAWSALIAGYTQQGQGHEALKCFEQMQREGLAPDVVTFASVLKACGFAGDVSKGQGIHKELKRRGYLGSNILLGNALLDMYARCGKLAEAQQVLEELPLRNVASWSALITGYSEQGQHLEALDCFHSMQEEGVSPDAIAYVCVLKACDRTKMGSEVKDVHSDIVARGLLEKSDVLGNALVDAYVKRGDLAEADRVHSDIFVQDVVSWSALIAGYAQHRQGQAALECYERMKCQGATPSEVTFVSILNACGSAGAIDEGERIHEEFSSASGDGLKREDAALGNALVGMYAKCGALEKARRVLETLPLRNVVTWNTVIAGYAQQGQGREALACLRRMEGEGIVPNAVSFLCVLNACSHSGLLHDAEAVFEDMTRGYGLSPSLEHETCMVVVYGCAGHFDKVMLLIRTFPRCECPSVWLALLGACRKWGNVKVGRLSFDRIVQLDRTCAAAYVLMSSIYLSAGMRDDALTIEELRLENKIEELRLENKIEELRLENKIDELGFGKRALCTKPT